MKIATQPSASVSAAGDVAGKQSVVVPRQTFAATFLVFVWVTLALGTWMLLNFVPSWPLHDQPLWGSRGTHSGPAAEGQGGTLRKLRKKRQEGGIVLEGDGRPESINLFEEDATSFLEGGVAGGVPATEIAPDGNTANVLSIKKNNNHVGQVGWRAENSHLQVGREQWSSVGNHVGQVAAENSHLQVGRRAEFVRGRSRKFVIISVHGRLRGLCLMIQRRTFPSRTQCV